MRNKVFTSFDAAVADIPDGASIAADCWGSTAMPQNLIAALVKHGARDLTIITHNFLPSVLVLEGVPSANLADLLPQMKKVITPVVGLQQLGAGAFVKEWVEKGLQVELTSHGTLASRLYAGAADFGGIYNPVGVGTILEEGKEKRVIDGREFIFERPIKPDYAFIRAHKADTNGNLVYWGVYRADQPIMAMAARCTIAEVDEIVPLGGIDAEHVITPGAFVDRIVVAPADGPGGLQTIKTAIKKLSEIDFIRKLLFK
jgi:3-oxoadipate CoA-transferase, alpha subunit